MEIVVANRHRKKKIDARFLKRLVAWCAGELKIERVELGIRLVGAWEMATAHEEFMDVPDSTDVITFDHGSAPPAAIHGEIFICIDDAIENARTFKTKWQEEAVRYTIHGILHLLGFDDFMPEARRLMKRQENRLLKLAAKNFNFAQLERN